MRSGLQHMNFFGGNALPQFLKLPKFQVCGPWVCDHSSIFEHEKDEIIIKSSLTHTSSVIQLCH